MFVRAGEKEQDIYRVVREIRKKRKKNTQTMRSVDGKGPKTKSEGNERAGRRECEECTQI